MPRTRAGKGRQDRTNGTAPHGGAAVFDLGAHRLAERFDVPIVAPDGTPTPMVVTLMSRYSPEYRARALQAQRARIAAASATAKPDTDAGGADGSEDDAVEAFILETIVSVTADWRGFVLEGAPMPCTPEHARALYTSPGLGWLYKQVGDAYLARERFFVQPGSA